MKVRLVFWIVLGLAALFVVSALRPDRTARAERAEFDLDAFGRLPVLDGGRLKPIDTVARNALVYFRGRQSAMDEDGRRIPHLEWAADVLFDRETAAGYRVFRVDNPDLLGLLGSSGSDVVHFSYAELAPHLGEIERQARLAPEESALRNRFQNAVLRLRIALIKYQSLETSLVPHLYGEQSVSTAYARFDAVLPDAVDIMRTMETGGRGDNLAINDFVRLTTLFRQVADSRSFLAVPEMTAVPLRWNETEWSNPGKALLARVHGGSADPVVAAYGRMADAWVTGDAPAFSAAVEDVNGYLRGRLDGFQARAGFEYFFNGLAPFYLSLQLYVLAFLAICFAWLWNTRSLNTAALIVICVALVPHTFGLAARVYLSGYAPVTNLYSSAVFVGWGAVLFAVPMEWGQRNGLAAAAAALTGFCTLVIAHNLAVAGGTDTMEMMRAVLDSNFWLATHVITIIVGYSAVFLAAAMGLFFIVRGVFTRSLDLAAARSIERMVYGATCFALLFTFLGTVLGGVWADQSWGRFWGWDPKENGALMLVLWAAMMLHAKRIRMVERRGFMALAIGGGIVTSWAWFGTNLLGVGLHSYGFMDRGFFWLVVFWVSQLAVIGLAGTRPEKWRSGAALER